MRPIRRKDFRRRPRRFRFRPRGFSEHFTGPIYRGAFKFLGVPPEQRRAAYNLLAIAMVGIIALGMGISGGVGGLVGGLVVGWFVVKGLRYFR
jgi:membrane associated rhomboid family serine protease